MNGLDAKCVGLDQRRNPFVGLGRDLATASHSGAFRFTGRKDRPGNGTGGQPGAPESPDAVPGAKRSLFRRLQLWAYRRRGGDLAERAERLATDPDLVAVLGAEEARRIAYQSYNNVFEDSVLGQATYGTERR